MSEKLLMAPEILTANGHYFNLLYPQPSSIDIRDIAHALARINRFTGHTRQFYSVAQHCYHVSELVPRKYALEGLLHDAAEAYMGDIASPLKQLLPDYKRIYKGVEKAVFAKFGIAELPPCVKEADLKMLAAERAALMPATPDREWEIIKGIQVPSCMKLIAMLPQEAEERFLFRWQQCISGHFTGL